jgi:D-alanyl-D-alanine dipeptidase
MLIFGCTVDGLRDQRDSIQREVIADVRELDDPLVEIASLDPSIVIDVRYATADNFVGRPMYPVGRAFLRGSAADHLVQVQQRLREQGLGLKIWDAYRPLSVQWALWEAVPDPNYVADPRRGSRHNRGAAVDLTLVDAEGRELAMPTGYDEFSERAHLDFVDLDAEILRNRAVLQEAMIAEGFQPLSTEWWHFDAPGWRDFPLLDIPLEDLVQAQDHP